MSITQTEFSTNIDKYIILSQTEDVYVTLDNKTVLMLGKKSEVSLAVKSEQDNAFMNFLNSLNENKFDDEVLEIIAEARRNDYPQERDCL